VRDAHAGGVEQAADLLGAGPAGRDQADRTGADDVGEAERDPGDDRGATSCSTGTPSLNTSTLRPAAMASAASAAA
jgi:hypothetical protein